MVISPQQAAELFHLHLVRLLCAGPDKGAFAVKGGRGGSPGLPPVVATWSPQRTPSALQFTPEHP